MKGCFRAARLIHPSLVCFHFCFLKLDFLIFQGFFLIADYLRNHWNDFVFFLVRKKVIHGLRMRIWFYIAVYKLLNLCWNISKDFHLNHYCFPELAAKHQSRFCTYYLLNCNQVNVYSCWILKMTSYFCLLNQIFRCTSLDLAREGTFHFLYCTILCLWTNCSPCFGSVLSALSFGQLINQILIRKFHFFNRYLFRKCLNFFFKNEKRLIFWQFYCLESWAICYEWFFQDCCFQKVF